MTHTDPSPVTVYFRRTIEVESDASCLQRVLLDANFAHGLLLAINGQEVYRFNLPLNTAITASTFASDYEYPDHRQAISLSLASSGLKRGTNTIAGEVHMDFRARFTMFDLALDVEMSRVCGPASVTETCDGRDNNEDGLVDQVRKAGIALPLSQNCTSSCGSGSQTCMSGTWTSCNITTLNPGVSI